jgi:hypothetical protein
MGFTQQMVALWEATLAFSMAELWDIRASYTTKGARRSAKGELWISIPLWICSFFQPAVRTHQIRFGLGFRFPRRFGLPTVVGPGSPGLHPWLGATGFHRFSYGHKRVLGVSAAFLTQHASNTQVLKPPSLHFVSSHPGLTDTGVFGRLSLTTTAKMSVPA